MVFKSDAIENLAQLRARESRLCSPDGGWALMEQAGIAAATVLTHHWPLAKHVTLCVGPGHNGGDGLVLAAKLHALNLDVLIIGVGELRPSDPCLAQAHALISQAGLNIMPSEAPIPAHTDLIVDALLGIGATLPLRDSLATFCDRLSEQQKPLLALDQPTGVDADTGAVDSHALKAQATITFLGLTPGLLTGDALSHIGALYYAPLVDSRIEEHTATVTPPASPSLIEPGIWHWLATTPESLSPPTLPALSCTRHKGMSSVHVFGGFEGMGGAGILSARAALQAGAGRVWLHTSKDTVMASLAHCPEVMARVFEPALEPPESGVFIIGPGAGQQVLPLLSKLAQVKKNHRLVLDADVLHPNLITPLVGKHELILTPHPKEAARLLQTSVEQIQSHRLEAAKKIANQFQCTVVLKGPGTLIANANQPPWIYPFAHGAFATSGLGDVLSGIIAALYTGEESPRSAAQQAVIWHAHAGMKVAKTHRTVLASDLIGAL